MLAAIDHARAQMQQHGQTDYLQLLDRIAHFVHQCRACGIDVIDVCLLYTSALGAEEGRGKLRKATGSRKQALNRGYPNGATRRW